MTHTVLIVEDEDSFRFATEKNLMAAGFSVISAPNSMIALDKLKHETIDLMLVDVAMPAGMPHGLSLARMARMQNPDMPIFFVTAYRELAEFAREVSGKVFCKPVDLDEIVDEIKIALSSGARAPSGSQAS